MCGWHRPPGAAELALVPLVPLWPLRPLSLLVGRRDQHADRKCRAPVLAFGQGHFAEVSGIGGPGGRPLGGHVAAGVFGQVVASHEAAVAHVAHKLLLAGVRPAVARKLIGTSKLFVAAVPVAAERLLACRGRGDGGWLEGRQRQRVEGQR